MKVLTLTVAAALALLATDAAMARGRRGCPSGNCYVGGGVVQAPIQKGLAQTEPSPSDAAKTAEAAPEAPAPVAVAPAPQRTRRFASFRLGRRN